MTAYKKDQGRYARMTAFWALFALVGYGCFTGLVYTIRRWFGESVTEPLMEDLPLLGTLDIAMLATLIVLAISGYLIHRTLNRPKLADMLIETESELRKVTWPSSEETWNGTVAVVLTVLVLLGFLFVADLFLSNVLTPLMARS